MLCKKREMNGCEPWMKREGLYTSGVVGNETTYMRYIKQELCSMSPCLKQCLQIWNNIPMFETTSTYPMVSSHGQIISYLMSDHGQTIGFSINTCSPLFILTNF